jgi:hypothetical protein
LIAFDESLDPTPAARHRAAMPSWTAFSEAAPDLAAAVAARFDAHKHLTLASLRRDGAPRISGTEVDRHDGELWLGSMPDALKARDLLRDPRFALHSGSDDPDDWQGDAKVAGLAIEDPDPDAERPYHRFRLDITEASTVGLSDDRKQLVIRVWTPDRGVREIRRT